MKYAYRLSSRRPCRNLQRAVRLESWPAAGCRLSLSPCTGRSGTELGAAPGSDLAISCKSHAS
eukprot:scaffold9903_cov106-Isochrysis_galbana.AAC.6